MAGRRVCRTELRHINNAPRAAGYLCLLLCLLLSRPLIAQPGGCPGLAGDGKPVPVTPTRVLSVDAAIDGDSLRLVKRHRNSSELRVIGINALELYPRDRRAAAPEAEQARIFVQNWLQRSGGKVGIIAGIETHDRHGRLLAHVFNRRGESLAAALLNNGHALAAAVAPNVRCAEALTRLEHTARVGHKGLWHHNAHTLRPQLGSGQSLRRQHQGFLLMVAGVPAAGNPARSKRLLLDNGLRVKLSPPLEAGHFVGHLIEIRGWVRRYRGRHWLTLQHPTNIRLLD